VGAGGGGLAGLAAEASGSSGGATECAAGEPAAGGAAGVLAWRA